MTTVKDDVAEFERLLTFRLLPWQRKAAKAVIDGSANFLFTPRQNGKSQVILFVVLYYLFLQDKKIIYTSHLVKSCTAFWRKLYDQIRFNSNLSPLVAKTSMAHGSQMAQLTTGGMVELMTRSSKNGVGDTADIVILDESQYIREEELAALLPTQITRSDMRTLYVGTPPPDYSDGSVIRAFRKKLYHTDQWLEYSLNNYLELTEKTLDDIELTSPEVLKATNPSYPELVKADNLKTEAVIMHRDTYLREHLGYWADDAPRRLFDKKIWDNLAAPQKVVFDNPAIGVYFSVDGETVSVVVAQKMEGQTYVQAVDTRATRQGLDWLADWILERRQIRVMYFDGIGSESLAQKIKPKYIKKVKLSRVAEVINANSLMLQKFFEGSIRHFDQPGLNQAILSCEKRPIGKAGGFGFQPIYDDIPVYLVPAMALAVYGAEKNDTTQKIVSI